MDETNGATAATRVAIEFLTLWMESDRRGAIEHIVRVLNVAGANPLVVIGGQLDLSLSLVTMLAKERGAGADDLLENARGILHDLSRDLPE
jgi:hypothetical protein